MPLVITTKGSGKAHKIHVSDDYFDRTPVAVVAADGVISPKVNPLTVPQEQVSQMTWGIPPGGYLKSRRHPGKSFPITAMRKNYSDDDEAVAAAKAKVRKAKAEAKATGLAAPVGKLQGGKVQDET